MTFFNIFSPDKVPESEKIEITIDNREKNSLVPSFLTAKGFKINFKQLPVGDYLFNNTAIERKSLSDFKSSIINKRLFQQLEEIKQYPQHLLLIEGITSEQLYDSGINENAFRGALLSVALEYQVPIIFTENEEDSARYISILAAKKDSPHTSLRPSKITLTPEQRLQFILEGFPQIGPATAKKLLNKYKTLKNIITAPEEELQELLGKKSDLFLFLLNHEANLSDEKNSLNENEED